MTRTPLAVIQEIAAALSACETAFEMKSSAFGAMSTIVSATAVPWVSSGVTQSASFVEDAPRSGKQSARTDGGSSVPIRDANPSNPPSRIPTFTPVPVKPACSQAVASWSAGPGPTKASPMGARIARTAMTPCVAASRSSPFART